jgi:DNA-binding NarL/FixJ family response regulator
MPTDETSIRGQSADADCPLFVFNKLTKRELDVLTLAARGCTGKEIARQLSVAEITVKKHREAVVKALAAANITHAVAIAVTRGLIGPDTFLAGRPERAQ